VFKKRRDNKENIVGYICLWQGHDELRIPNLAVHPAFRRQGIATELLSFAFELCTQENMRKVSLEVRAHNQSAQRLYQGLGFQFVGRRPDFYRDTGEDALLLEYDFSTSACSRPNPKEKG
jgi:ribosomal-protein-alanine N-acetyltransferase